MMFILKHDFDVEDEKDGLISFIGLLFDKKISWQTRNEFDDESFSDVRILQEYDSYTSTYILIDTVINASDIKPEGPSGTICIFINLTCHALIKN